MRGFFVVLIPAILLSAPLRAGAEITPDQETAVRNLCERVGRYYQDSGIKDAYKPTECGIKDIGAVLEKMDARIERTDIGAGQYCGQGMDAYACTDDGIPSNITVAYRNMVNYSGRDNGMWSQRLRDAGAVCIQVAKLCKNWTSDSAAEFEKLNREFMEIQARTY